MSTPKIGFTDKMVTNFGGAIFFTGNALKAPTGH